MLVNAAISTYWASSCSHGQGASGCTSSVTLSSYSLSLHTFGGICSSDDRLRLWWDKSRVKRWFGSKRRAAAVVSRVSSDHRQSRSAMIAPGACMTHTHIHTDACSRCLHDGHDQTSACGACTVHTYLHAGQHLDHECTHAARMRYCIMRLVRTITHACSSASQNPLPPKPRPYPSSRHTDTPHALTGRSALAYRRLSSSVDECRTGTQTHTHIYRHT